jgi:hypothetical protein
MATVFLEVVFEPGTLRDTGFESRDEIEDPLHETLQEAGLGEVTGGGGGIYGSNIDIEISDARRFDEALALIRQVLRNLNVPHSTVIVRHKPKKITYPVYEAEELLRLAEEIEHPPAFGGGTYALTEEEKAAVRAAVEKLKKTSGLS